MNIIDIIILLCFVPAIINGLRKGLVAQVVAIISIVLGVWLSFKFSSAVSGWMAGLFDGASPTVLEIVAFTVILVVVIFALFALGKIIEASIKIVMLGWLNRLLGLLFSLLKCTLIVGLVIIMFSSLNSSLHLVSEKVLADSILYPPFKETAYSVFPYLKDLIFK